MLQYLHIENIAVIEEANIDFTSGFNVMTGETGAGKSIIIDALFAILGERTSRELIRFGCDKAVVSASFTDIGDEALSQLSELGHSVSADEELIIQRVLFADGRGQVKINMQPANVSALKEVGKLLINIHGQHDNQTLLNAEKHMSFIDAFAENISEREKYLTAFNEFRDITRELNKISVYEEEKARRLELLKFQVDEIEKAEITEGEEEKLKAEIKLLEQSETVLQHLNSAGTAILGNDGYESASALDLLRSAIKSLEGISAIFKKAEKTYETLSGIALDLEAAAADITALSEEIHLDPKILDNCVLRLDLIHSLMLKYGNTERDVLDYLANAKKELEAIELDNERKALLEGMLEPAEQRLIDAGNLLTKSRTRAAAEICKQIEAELEFLDFDNAVFVADVTSGKYTKNGCDYAEFLISANLGEQPKPLAKIASGGELSRIMLAIRSVLSLRDDVGTLIFDEIDSGISGHAANKVATKLYEVSKQRQVICVTHLAQIAAAADNHLFISKSVRDAKTYTKVEKLDYSGKVREIARIMSGGEYTDNLLKTAEEMIGFFKK